MAKGHRSQVKKARNEQNKDRRPQAHVVNNNELDENNLYVADVVANQGPTLKRIRPRAQGRAYRINKKTAHISIYLDEKK